MSSVFTATLSSSGCQNRGYSGTTRFPAKTCCIVKGVVIVIRAVVVGVSPFTFADPESVLVFEAAVAQNTLGCRRQNCSFFPVAEAWFIFSLKPFFISVSGLLNS